MITSAIVVVLGAGSAVVGAVLVRRWLRNSPDPAWHATGFRYTSEEGRDVVPRR